VELLFGKKAVTALDLGEHGLKCATVEPETARIRGLVSIPLMPERQLRAEFLDAEALQARLRAALPDCRKRCAPFQKSVVLSLPPRAGSCGYLELPPLTDHELALAVPSKVSKLIPFPLADVSVSHMVVPRIHPEGEGRGVVYVSVQNAALRPWMDLLEPVGLRVLRAELPAISLAREFRRNHPDQDGDFVALVNLGFRSTTVALARGGFPYLARSFSVGGADFTYAFQMGSQSTWERAEAYKRGYDFSARETAIEPFLVRWMDEVAKTLTQFERRFNAEGLRVGRALLSGGEAAGRGLAERLAEHLGLPVEVDGWATLRGPEDAPPGLFKVAVGLALED